MDYREEALSNSFRSRNMYLLGKVRRDWMQVRVNYLRGKENHVAELSIGQDIQLKAFQAAIEALEEYAKAAERTDTDIVNTIIFDYRRMMDRLKTSTVAHYEKKEEQKEELRLKLMEIERAEIHSMYEAGEIGREQARELRRFVNYIESVILLEHVE